MSDEQVVLLALARSDWETDLVLAVGRELTDVGPAADRGPGASAQFRVRRAVDVVDVLSSVDAGSVAVVALDPSFPRLTEELVERLLAREVVVLAVCPDAPAEIQARRLGMEWAVEVGAGELSRAARSIVTVANRRRAGRSEMPGSVTRLREPGPDSATRSATGATVVDAIDVEDSVEGARGRLVAVWGPPGAPGRTSVALALAHLASLRGVATMIIDGDVRTPGVAAALGLEPDSSGLAAAATLADRGALTAHSLARQARQLGDRWRVLTGIASADRWAEVTPTGVSAVIDHARELDELVVVDVGSNLIREDDVLFDELLPRRDAPAFCALAAADLVVAVGNCEPIGLARMLSSLPQLREATSAPVIPVVNRVRRSLGDFGSRRRLGELLARADLVDPVSVPDDRATFDGAVRRQLLPTEHDSDSEFGRAMSALVQLLMERLGASTIEMAAGY